MSTGLSRCGRYQSRRRESRASFARWESRRFMTGCASRRCSIDWNRSSSRCSMKPTSDIGEGDSTKDAMRKVWKEIQSGREWIVDGDLKEFFGSVDHAKLLSLVAQRIADGRVLRLIEAMLKAGSCGKGRLYPTERGTPQGGVVSPVLSNVLLTPFDREMRRKGYQVTRYADDWVITCNSAAEAHAAIAAAQKILEQLCVVLHPQKTRVVHV